MIGILYSLWIFLINWCPLVRESKKNCLHASALIIIYLGIVIRLWDTEPNNTLKLPLGSMKTLKNSKVPPGVQGIISWKLEGMAQFLLLSFLRIRSCPLHSCSFRGNSRVFGWFQSCWSEYKYYNTSNELITPKR